MYRGKRVKIDWDVYVHWMMSDPNFISRYTRRGCLVVDKETGEVVYEIVCDKPKDVYKKRD